MILYTATRQPIPIDSVKEDKAADLITLPKSCPPDMKTNLHYSLATLDRSPCFRCVMGPMDAKLWLKPHGSTFKVMAFAYAYAYSLEKIKPPVPGSTDPTYAFYQFQTYFNYTVYCER